MKQLLRSTFLIPAMLAALTLVGLVAALFGGGGFDILSWLCLGSAIAVIVLARIFAGARDQN
ncbi:hypothetical protein [Ponticaulis sp.]|uniref:hypothetical protein n=1 Tax=Ponticaulis sp. TaxID=2020902 RepID=UPI000C3E80A9|nr:hypothetical protein [Ponticaulis sp.]MAF57579.1 hypothetical protein [Ponticaulis sp.]MBN05904.1 hypothetical protein [Ponticaulis sp.]|tara:strand:+ start:133 stop:318 length:186 start_codon:yes stop_codon:yes gene_type:complete